MDEQVPKAWLPAFEIANDEEKRYESLLIDLCALGHRFVFKCWDWDGYRYQHSVDAEIWPSRGHHDEASIQLRVMKRYQARIDVENLEAKSFRRSIPTSPIWSKKMRGKPSPKALANHTLYGIKMAAGFKSNMGFDVSAESNQVQKALDAICGKHRVWGVPVYPNIWFLNT